jgi:hypothetical protein
VRYVLRPLLAISASNLMLHGTCFGEARRLTDAHRDFGKPGALCPTKGK